jgi:hypothetical protein
MAAADVSTTIGTFCTNMYVATATMAATNNKQKLNKDSITL